MNKRTKMDDNPFAEGSDLEEDANDATVHRFKDEEGEVIKLVTTKCYDTTRDMYFVRLVAGRLNRTKKSLIEIQKIRANRDQNTKHYFRADARYEYTDDLLSAWAGVVEELKKAVRPEDEEAWRSTRYAHDKLVMSDTTCVPFAHYVAFVMMTVGNKTAPRSRTRYDLGIEQEEHDKMLNDVLRGMHKEYGVIHPTYVQEYFEGTS